MNKTYVISSIDFCEFLDDKNQQFTKIIKLSGEYSGLLTIGRDVAFALDLNNPQSSVSFSLKIEPDLLSLNEDETLKFLEFSLAYGTNSVFTRSIKGKINYSQIINI